MENEAKKGSHNPKYCFSVRGHKMFCAPCSYQDCFRAELLEADKSAFHTDQVAEATRSINKILSEIQLDSEGRSLALIQTTIGIMLAWVDHEDEASTLADKEEVAVTSRDDNATLAKALNLKNY